MRCACVLTDHLPTQVELKLDPLMPGSPVVIVRDWDERVIDISPSIRPGSICLGDNRRRVEQLEPQAIILPAQEAIYQRFHDVIQNGLREFTDTLENQGLGMFFLDVERISRTFPSETALGLHILSFLRESSPLVTTIGIATNKFAALQAAKAAQTRQGCVATVPAGKERSFLADLPLTVLPDIPPEIQRRLLLFGITTMGGLAQLPRPAMTLQFGPEAAVFLDLARGIDTRPLFPYTYPPILQYTRSFVDAISDRQQTMTILNHVAERLSADLSRQSCHTTALALTVSVERGKDETAGTTLRPPSSDITVLQRAIARLLDKVPPLGPITKLCVVAYPLCSRHAGARQLAAFSPPRSQKWPDLHRTIRALRQRFGEAAIQIASVIAPPPPLAIQVHLDPQYFPTILQWDGQSHQVVRVCETWKEQRRWWDDPIQRQYCQLETQGGIVYTVFQDDHGYWFLERRYTV